jgi:hypothetical protein
MYIPAKVDPTIYAEPDPLSERKKTELEQMKDTVLSIKKTLQNMTHENKITK